MLPTLLSAAAALLSAVAYDASAVVASSPPPLTVSFAISVLGYFLTGAWHWERCHSLSRLGSVALT